MRASCLHAIDWTSIQGSRLNIFFEARRVWNFVIAYSQCPGISQGIANVKNGLAPSVLGSVRDT